MGAPLEPRRIVRRKGPSFIASFGIGLVVAAAAGAGYHAYIQRLPGEIRGMDEVLMIFFAIPTVVIAVLLVHLVRNVVFAITSRRYDR